MLLSALSNLVCAFLKNPCKTLRLLQLPVSNLRLDFCQRRLTAAVLHGIVQQGGDCLCLRSAVFENESRHGKDMRDVGNLRTLPCLFAVKSDANCRASSNLPLNRRFSFAGINLPPPWGATCPFMRFSATGNYTLSD